MTGIDLDHPLRNSLPWRLIAHKRDATAEQLHPNEVLYDCARSQLPQHEELGRSLLKHGVKPGPAVAMAFRAAESRAGFRLLGWSRGRGRNGCHWGSPLGYAVEYGQDPWACRLLALGANPNHRHRQTLPLIAAVRRGDLSLTARLLKAGALPQQTDRLGQTAIKVAAAQQHPALLLLVESWDPRWMQIDRAGNAELDTDQRLFLDRFGQLFQLDSETARPISGASIDCGEDPPLEHRLVDYLFALLALRDDAAGFQALLHEAQLPEPALKLILKRTDPARHPEAVRLIKLDYVRRFGQNLRARLRA